MQIIIENGHIDILYHQPPGFWLVAADRRDYIGEDLLLSPTLAELALSHPEVP
jgi:hypothetical protein